MAVAANARPSTPLIKLSSTPCRTEFAQDCTGTSTQRQANRKIAPHANGPHQQQARDIDAGNQQYHDNCHKQCPEQWADLRNSASRTSLTSPRMRSADLLAGKLRMTCQATRSASCAAWGRVHTRLKAGHDAVTPQA